MIYIKDINDFSLSYEDGLKQKVGAFIKERNESLYDNTLSQEIFLMYYDIEAIIKSFNLIINSLHSTDKEYKKTIADKIDRIVSQNVYIDNKDYEKIINNRYKHFLGAKFIKDAQRVLYACMLDILEIHALNKIVNK